MPLTFKKISAQDLKNVDFSKAVMLDVRTHTEHMAKCLACEHIHVPLDQLNPDHFMMRHGFDRGVMVYIVCRSGARATRAANQFLEAGYSNVCVVEGGLLSCEECGHEIVGEATKDPCGIVKRGITMERQVRILAGSLIVIGSLLGLLCHISFVYIALFVGAGLVYSGITDWCGMALLLMKAPWNRDATRPDDGDTDSHQEGKVVTPSDESAPKDGQDCK